MSEQPPATFEESDEREASAEVEAVETPVTTGASSVIRALEDAGVETCFGVQGGAIMPVYDAL